MDQNSNDDLKGFLNNPLLLGYYYRYTTCIMGLDYPTCLVDVHIVCQV